jgi:hypothetical protein
MSNTEVAFRYDNIELGTLKNKYSEMSLVVISPIKMYRHSNLCKIFGSNSYENTVK